MRCLILLMICVLARPVISQEYSNFFWNYMCTHDGHFSNNGAPGSSDQKEFNATVFPVDYDFMPKKTFVFAETYDRNIQRIQVRTIEQKSDTIIIMTPYKVTNQKYYAKDLSMLNIQELSKITKDDVQLQEGCFTKFEYFEETGCFQGGWEVCGTTVEDVQTKKKSNHPHFGLQLCCDYATVMTPAGITEGYTDIPYYLRKVIRFPIAGLPAGIKGCCEKKGYRQGD